MIFPLFAVFGGVLYRWRGMDHPWKKYTPNPLPEILFAAPFAWVGFQTHWIAGLIVWAITTLAVLTGHGKFMSLGQPMRGDDETIEFIIKPLERKIDDYWYRVLGLWLKGTLIVGGAALVSLSPPLLIAGAALPIAYMASWKIGTGNEGGEFLTGLGLWGLLLLHM